MQKTLYKAGYLIRVVSWENDGDHYSTEEMRVDSLEEAQGVYALCNLLRSSYAVDYKTYGNMYDPSDNECAEFTEAMLKVPNIKKVLESICAEALEDPDFAATFDHGQAAYEIIGWLGLTSDPFYTRVCESVKVYHIPADIIVTELEM